MSVIGFAKADGPLFGEAARVGPRGRAYRRGDNPPYHPFRRPSISRVETETSCNLTLRQLARQAKI